MSLANLTITINANTSAAQSGMRGFGDTARTTMTASTVAVDDFRSGMVRANEDVVRASQQMGTSMRAANDAIVTSGAASEKAMQKVADTANTVDVQSFGERIAAAVGAGMGAGYVAAQTWVDKTEQFVKARLTVMAVGLAIGVTAGAALAVYSVYKIIGGTVGFIKGLFTGESYQSDNIDKLIALNDQVKDLQTNLHVSAQEASALLDVTARLGVDKKDYTATYKAAEAAMRANSEELDRLGVKYKDSNGQLLDQRTFLENVKKALDEYRDGWDRNSAAVAMGAGTYDQIVATLKVTEEQLQTSKARLDEYGNGFGPERQAAVEAYEQAMRNFKNEMRLTGEGFSGAIADQIMPALTTLANFFQDGWPLAVRAFRYSMATITSLAYGIKTVFDIVADAGIGTVTVLADGFMSLSTAAVRALKGDMAGAAQALTEGWHKAGSTVSKTMDEIVADATHNRDAMLLAWGLDDRTMGLAQARAERLGKGGKPWTPKPAPVQPSAQGHQSQYQNYMDELDRTLAKLNENEYASMRLRAEQLAQKEGITNLTAAYDKINRIQRDASQGEVDKHVRKMREESDAYAFQTSIMGETALQQDKLSFAMQKRLEVEQMIAAAVQSHRPLDAKAIEDLRAQTEETIRLGNAQRDARNAASRSGAFGVTKALQDYQDAAGNMAKNAETMVNGSLQRMEDALISFAKTGKLSFSSLFSFMAEEWLRQNIRMQMASGMGGTGFLGSLFKVFGLVTGGSSVTGATGDFARMDRSTPLATGTNYVPFDGMKATLHKGEAVVPAAYNPAAGGKGGGLVIDMSGQVLNVGQGVSRAEVASALKANQAQTVERIRRLDRQGRFA